MQQFEGISESQLAKRAIVFDLESVLFDSKHSVAEKQKIFELLEKLSGMEKLFSSFVLFLVSGYSEKQGQRILVETGFAKFFKPGNVFFVSQSYIDSMQEIDKKRYSDCIAKDFLFQDDYFKQIILQKLAADLACATSDIVFVCHDLLTDAYYSMRFSKAEIVLVKNSLSIKHVASNQIVKGLNYVSLDWQDIKAVLLGKTKPTDYSFLNKFIEKFLQQEIIGGLKLNLGALMQKKKQQPN